MSLWDLAQSQAENNRNFSKQYSTYGADQGNWQGDGSGGSAGGEGGGGYGGHEVNWSGEANFAPNKAPKAYGLSELGLDSSWGDNPDDHNAAQMYLSRVRQYDPNAKIEEYQQSKGGDSGDSEKRYRINYDESKLPKKPKGDLVSAGGYGSDRLFNTNDSALYNDPDYGVMTSKKNFKPEESGWLDKVGMYAPIALAALTGGMGALPSFAMKVPGMLESAVNGHFDPVSAGISALGVVPGLEGVGQVAGGAYQLSRGNPFGAASAARPFLSNPNPFGGG
jgi:hypothetical protein